ncbi:dihydrolipoamide acetyltransferase family protein [Streptomyces sp. NPDC001380]|uniref:dihydrolipoamide acetyltransferase family protein n=1 Tax=Streptomyces sp. NPDC001380 TaxID=3364566 RepID=UPI003684897C
MGEFRMPALGADMTEGTVAEWLVGPGDRVRRGDLVAVVDTAKAAIEVECFESGVVERLLVPAGEAVAVGTPLAVIGAGPGAGGAGGTGAGGGAGREAERAGGGRAAPAGPLVRHLAEQAGLDLAEVRGSGPGGRVTRADVAHLTARGPGTGGPAPGRGAGTAPGAAVPAPPPRAAPEPPLEPAPPAPPAPEGPARTTVRPAAGPRAGARTGARAAAPRTPPPPPPAAGAPPAAARAAAPAGPAARVRVTPLARRTAAELGVDPARLRGTGEDGAVRAADVRRAAARQARPERRAPAGPGAPGGAGAGQLPAGRAGAGRPRPEAPARRAPAAQDAAAREEAMRQAVGDLMSRSKREIPHYYLSTTVDLAAATAWMRRRNRELPVGERLVPAALLLKAAALAAREVPRLNGFWTDGRFVPAPDVHLGVAVALRGGGLVAPAIHGAADMTVPRLMAALRDLAARTRTGRLRRSETTDATLTVTSLGDQGVEAVLGVIHPPQVALVGFGRVAERPWAADGMLGVRPVVTATLSADHRASDGATGARYLTALDRLLQRPEEL